MEKIAPGSTVNLKIVKTPTNLAAVKTLVRLLSKDATVITENKRLEKIRVKHYNPRMRGGRPYGGQLVKQRPVKGQAGESGTITATLDVIADLASVQRFIEVSAA